MSNKTKLIAMSYLLIFVTVISMFVMMMHAEIWIDMGIRSYWECTIAWSMLLVLYTFCVVTIVNRDNG